MATLKMLFLLFLPCKFHPCDGKMTRNDVKEESDYHVKGHMSIIVKFGNSSGLTWICRKLESLLIRKDSTIKDTSILWHMFWKVYPGVFSRLCVTHSKKGNKGNLKPKDELIIFFFLKIIWKSRLSTLTGDGKHSLFNYLR